MKRLALFASGTGSNARKIVEYFFEHEEISPALIVTNKRNAGVLEIAKEYDIATCRIDRNYFYESEDILNVLENEGIDYIILAGFLWMIPSYLINRFPDKIINIHPSLLPKYGGKGMYGIHVHRAVKKNKESESGMTIHLVNEEYDKGRVLFQASVTLSGVETPEEIAAKVLKLEHANYARVIEAHILDKK